MLGWWRWNYWLPLTNFVKKYVQWQLRIKLTQCKNWIRRWKGICVKAIVMLAASALGDSGIWPFWKQVVFIACRNGHSYSETRLALISQMVMCWNAWSYPMVQWGLAQSFSAFHGPRNHIPITYVTVTISIGLMFVNFQPRIEAEGI